MSTVQVDLIENKAGGAVRLTGFKPAFSRIDFDQKAAADRESTNVSSVTDTSNGLFTVNFTNAFLDNLFKPMYNVMEDAAGRGMSAASPTISNYGDNKTTLTSIHRSELQNNNPADTAVNSIAYVAGRLA